MKCLIFNCNHVFCDGICEVFFLKTFFLEEFGNIKSQRDVTKMLHVHYLSFLRHKNASVVDVNLLDLNIIDVFSRINLMSTDTLRFFLESILEVIATLFQVISNVVSKYQLKINFKIICKVKPMFLSGIVMYM
jgi:hypothetical protein